MKNRPMGVTKKKNGYMEMIDRELYEKMPKAVFAAIAASYLLNHQNVNPENISIDLRTEWRLLHEQGIVPQKPY